ncbi:ferredoxin [Telmatospirillum siberiense]|uniref:Periplasmic nitrate reductase, electron transfer subunit n=1 Tax=Telmatospirillum siberiense TaxID=382514 RepID=A0A2N3PWW8_9PROT|nr:ferredoxin [Telmatospirillum siberiense]
MAGALACGAAAVPPAVAEQIQSLRGGASVDEPDQAPPVYPIKEGRNFERSFRDQPPLIPHRIDKYEIDLKVNQCLRCHDWPNNTQEHAPLISVAHFLDRDGKKLDRVAPQRWVCTSCHVTQADAKALVPNRFRSEMDR